MDERRFRQKLRQSFNQLVKVAPKKGPPGSPRTYLHQPEIEAAIVERRTFRSKRISNDYVVAGARIGRRTEWFVYDRRVKKVTKMLSAEVGVGYTIDVRTPFQAQCAAWSQMVSLRDRPWPSEKVIRLRGDVSRPLAPEESACVRFEITA